MNLFETDFTHNNAVSWANDWAVAAQQVILHLKGKFTKVKFCH